MYYDVLLKLYAWEHIPKFVRTHEKWICEYEYLSMERVKRNEAGYGVKGENMITVIQTREDNVVNDNNGTWTEEAD